MSPLSELKLILIRGLPGSGKSTLARKKVLESESPMQHYEADQFFINKNTGNYEFDASQLHNAHQQCFERTKDSLKYHCSVVVSNTFTTQKEIRPYLELAAEVWCDVVEIYDCISCNYGSVHDVPEETMQKMAKRFVPNSQLTNLRPNVKLLLC